MFLRLIINNSIDKKNNISGILKISNYRIVLTTAINYNFYYYY